MCFRRFGCMSLAPEAGHEDKTDLEDSSAEEETKNRQEKFDLKKLPHIVHNCFIEKLQFFDWVLLRQCSKFSNKLCDSVRKRLLLDGYYIDIKKVKRVTPGDFMAKYLSNIPWRKGTRFPCQFYADSVMVYTQLTNEKLVNLYKTLYYKDIRAKQVFFMNALIDCDVSVLVQLAELLDITQLQTRVYFNAEFFNASIAQQLTAIYLDTCRMTDKQFLSLKAHWFEIRTDTITSKAINQYLKEWRQGKRELRMLDITFESSLTGRSKDELFAGVNANPVWSGELHQYSLLSSIPIDEMRELWDDDPRSFYCMWLSSEIRVSRYVEFNRRRLYIDCGNEEFVFCDLITPDQFYSVFKRCRYCAIEYCCHRKYYSVARLRKNYPLVWNSIMCVFKLSTVIVSGSMMFTGNRNYFGWMM